jgi:Protein of Unknown function (DUF2784)/Polyketide cyclase / dehydrase and lipid transport
MLYRLLTDLTVAVHFAFLVFVVAGGFLARRHRWLVAPHLLAAAWGVYVEATPGLVCPLTPLENAFAIRAGEAGYQGSFIEHYLVPILYPEGLTREAQWGLAAFVVAINAVAYGWPRRGGDRKRSLEAAIEIRASPEAVFDLTHDYTRRLEWDPFLKEARLLEGAEAAGLGVKSRCTARSGFGGLAMETVYVSFDRPRVAAVRMTQGPAVLETFAASLRQDAVDAGVTRVTYRFNFSTRPRWLRAIADPIAAALFGREVRQRLEALKRYLERPATPDDGRPATTRL